MENTVVDLNQEQNSDDAISERTRALRLIRSLVNIYRLCCAVPSSV
jgi:hypothetical protein